MFLSNVLISSEAEKNPLSLIENPHKSPFRKFFYDHSKVELFFVLCSNFYKKILSITRQRKYATAVAQLTLILNARVSYHKCHTHKLDAFWYRFTKQVLKFIRCSVCLANWYRKIYYRPTSFPKWYQCFVKMVNNFWSKSSKFCILWTIRFCSNFTSMWSKYLSNNVWRDFRLPMSASAIW